MAKPSFWDCMFTIPSTHAGRDHCRKVIGVSGLVVLGAYLLTRRRRALRS
jgi:MYXO-CTERM domain-containing protein